MTVDPVEFGKHAERISMLQTDVAELKTGMASANAKLDSVIVQLAEKRGERRMATAIAGFGGSLLGILFGWLAK